MPNLETLKETARSELCDILDSINGDKVLVLDEQLIGPLGLVAPLALLKELGVKKLFKLNDRTFDTNFTSIVYIVRPKMHLMKWVANQVSYWVKQKEDLDRIMSEKSKEKKNTKNKKQQQEENNEETYTPPTNFHLYLLPKTSLICVDLLKDMGVYPHLRISEFPLDLIVFDNYLMSLELPSSFKECELDGDFSSLYYVARSIMKLQSYFGLIPNVKFIGSGATHVSEMIMRMRKEVGSQAFASVPEINTLILIDRNVDLITPMLNQFTYEGLIDENLGGISNTLFTTQRVPEAATIAKKIALNSADSVFNRLRHLNHNRAGIAINEMAIEFKAREDKAREIKSETSKVSIEKIKEVTKMLPQIQEDKKYLELHTKIMLEIRSIIGKVPFRKLIQTQKNILDNEEEKEIIDYMEETIDKQLPLVNVLRVICLYSLINGGIKNKIFEKLRREIVQSYGLQALPTLNNLEKIGMLRKQDSKSVSNWNLLKKTFNLVDENAMDRAGEEDGQYDPHLVYNVYCPITVSLVEHAMNEEKGWRRVEPVLSKLAPGLYGEVSQTGSQDTQLGKKVVLVYFIGGVTFAEISAITYLNEKSNDCEYVIATTKLINGSTFLENLVEEISDDRQSFKKKASSESSALFYEEPPKETGDNSSGSKNGQPQDV